ncbi:hypothetical protein Vafri_21832 [Volvox africanus]|nr:hypothetical protein Vafri_21832 [Volvox africanus]
MSFKLHQALVLPGCWLRMSPSCHVEVISVLPEPQFPDQPLRIVPSTRLVLVSRTGAPPPQEQQEQEVHQHSSDMQLPEAHTPGRGRRGELKLHSELKKSVPGPASAEVHGLRDSAGGMWEDACGSSKSEAVLAFEGVHPPHVQDVEPSSVHECKNNPSAAGKYGRGNVRQTTAKGAAGRNIGPLKPCSSSQSTATAATATAAAVVAAAAAAAAAVEPSQLELTAEGADGVNPDEVKALVSDKSQGKAKAKSKAGSASGPGLKTGKSGSKSRSGNKGSNSGALTSSASLFDALRDLGDDD